MAKSSTRSRGEDNSPYVHQAKKLDFPISIRDLPWTEKQQQLIQLIQDKHTKCVVCKGPSGTAKAQPLYSKILTPHGWVKIGRIEPGDIVITPDSQTAVVQSVHPQGKKQVYRVHFSDKTYVDCTDEHLWNVKSCWQADRKTRKLVGDRKSKSKWQTKELWQIKEDLVTSTGRKKWQIPITSPIEFLPQDYKLDPYLLGLILGDGGIKYNHIIFSTKDQQLVDAIAGLLEQIECKITFVPGSNCDYRITGIKYRQNILLQLLRELGLAGTDSSTKFIPEQYFLGSIEQRLDLLRGIMDTDGWVNRRTGMPVFSTSSQQLSTGVKRLIESLGGITKFKFCETGYCKDNQFISGKGSYVHHINLPNEIVYECGIFKLERKQQFVRARTKYFPKRWIVSVEDLGIADECVCIKINHSDQLYITDNYTVTHNTITAVYTLLHQLAQKRISDITYIRPLVESAADHMGYLPGAIDDKIGPYTIPFTDKCVELLNESTVKRLIDDKRLSTQPINFLRGQHLAVKGIIVDEAQNAPMRDLVTVLTRIGEHSKLLILGDPKQSDKFKTDKNDFLKLYNTFDDEESREHGIFTFSFTSEDIVRSEFVRFVVHKLELNGDPV